MTTKKSQSFPEPGFEEKNDCDIYFFEFDTYFFALQLNIPVIFHGNIFADLHYHPVLITGDTR